MVITTTIFGPKTKLRHSVDVRDFRVSVQ